MAEMEFNQIVEQEFNPEVGIGTDVFFLQQGMKQQGTVTASKGLLLKVEFIRNESVKGSCWVPSSSVTFIQQAPTQPPKQISKTSSTMLHMDSYRGSVALAKSASYINKQDYMTNALSIVVVGASGDLAKKKTYPALLDLCAHGHLPLHCNIIGVARSVSDAQRLDLNRVAAG